MTNGSSQGLFVLIAVIIFGIFILMSYLLFRDTLNPSLSGIFKDEFGQINCSLFGECPIDIPSAREDENYLYAKIREANPKKNEKEIWIQAEKQNDGTLLIYKSSVSDKNYADGTSDMTGDLKFPDSINGMMITGFTDSSKTYGAFRKAKFSGELRLPSGLTTIGHNIFFSSTFIGELELPKGLTSICDNAFYCSKFSGELKLPKGLTSIGGDAFVYSKFSGKLDVSNVTYIQYGAFIYSKINKVIRGDVEMSDGSTTTNTSGIHPRSIKLANGEFYNGSNDN